MPLAACAFAQARFGFSTQVVRSHESFHLVRRIEDCDVSARVTQIRKATCALHLVTSHTSYGRGAGVGRGRGVGSSLGVGVGLGVDVGVGVRVAVAVGVAVAVAVAVGVAVVVAVGVGVTVAIAVAVGVGVKVAVGVGLAVGVGVGVPNCAQYLPPVLTAPNWSPPPQTIISMPVQTAV